jgi:hypothetical protein
VERVVFVEVLDRRSRVRERTRITSFPAYLGRAYSSDVIIEDRFVSPTHVVIREADEGELVIEDAGSANGMHRPGFHEPVDAAVLESGLRLRLGETTVRFVTADHLVAPAEILPRGASGFLELLKRGPIAVGLALFTVAVFTADVFLQSYYDFSWSAVFGPAVLGIVGLSLWAGVWAFVNRLMTHRFDFLRHLAVSCLASVASIGLWPLSEYAEFFFSSAALGQSIAWMTQAVVVASLIYAHLSIIPASSPLRRRGWAVGATAVVLGVAALFTYAEREDFSSDVAISVPLKSLGAEWAPAVSTDEFLERSRRVKSWVDDEVTESR